MLSTTTDLKRDASRPAIFLETFGCQMNILDSELVQSQFKSAGYEFVDSFEKADVVLLNTCSVRDLSEQKILSRLGLIKERKDKGEKVVVGILGCMAERAHEELLQKRSYIDVIVGPSKLFDTKALIEKAWNEHGKFKTKTSLSYFVKRKGNLEAVGSSPMDDLEILDRSRQISNQDHPWQAYVRITRGCNKFCSFCVVPRTRGPEMHRPLYSIIDEVKKLTDDGAKEVTLLGQTINHYFYEEKGKRQSFADLLFQIHESVPHLPRLRFLTSYPRDFTDEMLDVMASCERICRYLHIPAQSGSDKILKAMNRGYSVEQYLTLIEKAKNRMPDISIIGDMIVGFPGEEEEDFLKSLELLRMVRYKNVFVFKYSKRPDTVAYKRFGDEIPAEIKKERNNAMLALQNEISHELHKKMIGREYFILCEGISKLQRDEGDALIDLRTKSSSYREKFMGRTAGDHIVHFSNCKASPGDLLKAKITSARSLSLDGEVIL